VTPARPYREPAPIDPDPGPLPRSDLERLGPLRGVHVPPPLHRALVAPVLIAALVEGVGLVAGAPTLLVTPFALLGFALLSWPPLRLRGLSLELHAEGLVISRAAARDLVAFEDVNEIWFELDTFQGRAGAALRALRLVDHAGAAHHVPLGVTGAVAVVDAVLRVCSAPLLAEARRALDEGETLTFGRVELDRTGIRAGRARLSWPEIRLVVVQQARVFVYRRFPIFAWCTVRLDRIPHPTVFTALVTACAPRVRVDDQIFLPFASSAEHTAALKAEGPHAALRSMLYGGVLFLVGALVTWASYSANRGSYYLLYGPMVAGAVWFVRGLSAYLSGRGR
jgi:hypothetical protein